MDGILLVNTPSRLERLGRHCRLDDPKMPLGLCYVAAALREQGFRVSVFDAYALGSGVADILRVVREAAPRMVGMNCMSSNRASVLELALTLKQEYRGDVTVVVGGPEATLDPKRLLLDVNGSATGVDVVVAGEGERTLVELVQRGASAMVPGTYVRRGAQAVFSGPRDRIDDLDQLPWPALDMLPLEVYLARERKVHVLASRGCDHACTYCASSTIWGRKVKFRSPQNVARELVHWHGALGVDNFHFLDDNLTLWTGGGLKEFCQLLVPRRFSWRCIGRVDHLDESTVRLMARAGCYEVTFGVETGNQAMQARIKKHVRLDILPSVVRLFRNARVKTKAYFMIGFPGETVEQIRDTVRYARLLRDQGLDEISVYPVIPYFGTALYNEVSEGVKHARERLGDVEIIPDWYDEKGAVATRLSKGSIFPIVSAHETFDGSSLRYFVKHFYRMFYGQEPYGDECVEQLLRELSRTEAPRPLSTGA